MRFITLVLLMITYLAGCSAQAEQSVNSCLEREWKDVGLENITKEQRKYDLANDKDVHGGQYSCSGYITPTELNTFLLKLKMSLAQGDSSEVEELIYFPLVIIDERKEEGVKPKVSVVRDKSAFASISGEVFNPLIKRVIEYMSLANMATDPMAGIDAAYGGIIIKRFTESRRLYVTSISKDKAPMNKWLASNCK